MVRGGMFKGVIGLLLMASAIGACTPHLDSHRQNKRAPLSAKEAGWMVRGASTQEVQEFLETQPTARVRVVHPGHKIFEFTQVPGSIVQKFFAQYSVSENHFFHTQSNAAHSSMIISDLEMCLQRPNAPKVHIKAVSPQLEVGRKILNLDQGQNVFLETALEDKEDHLQISWWMTSPEGSNLKELQHEGLTLNFQPDMVGAFEITLVAQNDQGACGVDFLTVIVTANQKYLGPQMAPPLDKDLFPHLDELEVFSAWSVAEGFGVKVAVIDTGVNFNSPYLASNILTNPDEIPDNGIDDDENGFTDDWIGYDFTNADNSPWDDRGHGSHVAGLLASPTFGVARRAQIMPIKAMSPAGGDVATLVSAIYYAVDNGAQVINLSIGNYGTLHTELVEAINYAEKTGVLVVAAAGNGHPLFGLGMDTDLTPNFPSALPNENIISVAAKDSLNILAPYSNFGKISVDVVAPGGLEPGEMLLSVYVDNPQGLKLIGMTGTSMATPLVAGIAALVKSYAPEMDWREIRQVLLSAGREVEGLKELVTSGRHISARDALTQARNINPLCNSH